MGLCPWECKCLQNPEEGVRFPGVGMQVFVSHWMWVLWTEFRYPARVESALHHWAILPAPVFFSTKDTVVNKSRFAGLSCRCLSALLQTRGGGGTVTDNICTCKCWEWPRSNTNITNQSKQARLSGCSYWPWPGPRHKGPTSQRAVFQAHKSQVELKEAKFQGYI